MDTGLFSREKVKKLLPVFKAYAEGKDLQVNSGNYGWVDAKPDHVSFGAPAKEYRVKPETKKMVTLVFQGDHAVNTASVTVNEDLKATIIKLRNTHGQMLIKEFTWELEV